LVVGKLSWNADAAVEVHFTAQKCTVSEKLWTRRFLQDDWAKPVSEIITKRRSNRTIPVRLSSFVFSFV